MTEIQFPDFMAVTFGLVTCLIGEINTVGLSETAPVPDAITCNALMRTLPLLSPQPAPGLPGAAPQARHSGSSNSIRINALRAPSRASRHAAGS
jgi:hypothetical protein